MSALRSSILLACVTGTTAISAAVEASELWRGASNRSVLSNHALEARFQAGLVYQVVDRATGNALLHVDPSTLPSKQPVFGTKPMDLDACAVSTEAGRSTVSSRFRAPDGAEWTLRWTIEPGQGDLILHSSCSDTQSVEECRVVLFGCDISRHNLVIVNCSGVGEQYHAPWNGNVVGDPETGGSPMSVLQPLVALFDGGNSGWVVEGREPRIGPALLMVRGEGGTANLGLTRRFLAPVKTPGMYEIRIRAYQGRWENAVDPHIRWMEHDAGFTPIERLPEERAWVKEIKNQAYVRLGDFDGLEQLAKRLDPTKTLVGRVYGWRKYGEYPKMPNYEISDAAAKWFRRARELGFHVGAGFSAFLVDANTPELVEQFRPGFAEMGTDKDGNKIYQTLPSSPSPILYTYYCTPAFKPYRKYFVAQVRHAVEAGADVIYLDEAAWPSGAAVVDGMDGVQGVMELEKEILAAYPHVAIETEQFNPMASRYASFALTQMHAGHPLGGYIFHRFIHIVPEGIVSSPTDAIYLDAFQSYGYILPGVLSELTWLETAKAFQDYDLKPESRLVMQWFRAFTSDPSGGLVPLLDAPPAEGIKLFGYRGRQGVTAYFEKHPTKRGLIVYEQGKPPRWFGTRVAGIRDWPGPGVLKEWIPGVDKEVDWLIYDGGRQLALKPEKTYRLDESSRHLPQRFHIRCVPADFALYDKYPGYLRAQDSGRDGSFFKMWFTGHGELAMHVPTDVLVFLDGSVVPMDPAARRTPVTVNADTDEPSVILAFPKTDTELTGAIGALPWQVPPRQRTYFVTQQLPGDPNSFTVGVTAIIVLNGRLPDAESIRLQGAYKLNDETHVATTGDGVIQVNGAEVLRVPPGPRPFEVHDFNTDLSRFAGRHVLIEVICDGVMLAAPASAEWRNLRIVAGN